MREDLLSNAEFLDKIARQAGYEASKKAMDKFGYIVIWDDEMGVIKKYKDGTKIKI